MRWLAVVVFAVACGSPRQEPIAEAPPARVQAIDADPRRALGVHHVHVDGVEIAYELAGQGPLCVGLAGGPGFSSGYLHDGTLERHFTMVYLDLAGTGASEKLPESAQYSMDRDVATIEAVRDALGVAQICVLGHSYGGMVAQRHAIAHPAAVSGLVLYATTPTMGADWQKELDQHRAWFAKEPWYRDALEGRRMQAFASSQEESELAFWLEVPFYFADWTHHATDYLTAVKRSTYTWEVFRRRSWKVPFEARDELGAITAPTLVIAGDRDFMCGPGPSGVMAQGIRGAKLVVIPRVGHFAHVEAPQAFEQAIAAFAKTLPVVR